MILVPKKIYLFLLCLFFLKLVPVSAAFGDVKVSAKAEMLSENGETQNWVYRVELKNDGLYDVGPLVIQYRYSTYPELDPEGVPEVPLEHTAGEIPYELLKHGEREWIDTPEMNMVVGSIDVEEKVLQGVLVRVWSGSQLLAEFEEAGSEAASVDWPLAPPIPPTGLEAGEGAWLLVDPVEPHFGGLKLGVEGAETVERLKELGGGAISAIREERKGYPFYIKANSFPGCIFYFSDEKKMVAIEVEDPSRVKLPGDLVLNNSNIQEFDQIFGDPTDYSFDGKIGKAYLFLGAKLVALTDGASSDQVSSILWVVSP